MTPTVCVFNRTRETFLCLSAIAVEALRIPSADLQRFKETAREDGIWLAASTRGYVVGTLFPADLVYLDQRNRVIHLIEHLHPLQIVPVRYPQAGVLELPARTIYSSRTRVGDELLICSPEDVEMHWNEIRARLEEQIHEPGRECRQERSRVQTGWTKQEVIPCSKT